jgi:hypothetical protein
MARRRGMAASNIPGADVGITTCVIHPGTRRLKEQRERNFGIRVEVYGLGKLITQRAFRTLQLPHLDDCVTPIP